MCKASLYANHHVMAKDGATYGIATSDHGLPAFHPTNSTVEECLACIPNGKVLTFSNIPAHLQKMHGIADTATVTFVDTGDNKADMIQVAGAKKIPLNDFANCGVLAYVGVKVESAADVGAEPRQVVTV